MKHTKGPWIMEPGLVLGTVINNQGEVVTQAINNNARLIAAAPELLEAAKGALVAIRAELKRQGSSHWGLDNAVSCLENAIAKAQGGGK